MMPSSPSATARTAAPSVTQENTISERAATSRGVSANGHAHFDSGFGLVLVAVPAGDGVPGGDQARHDALAHHAEADKSEVHGYSASVHMRRGPQQRSVR